MKDIDEHCSNLSMLVSGYEPEIEWLRQSEWLSVASGIKSVEFDIVRFDSCFGWCRNADYWHVAREKLLESYITELTRFTYVWGALESLINDLHLPPGPEKGKINSICGYLKNKLSSYDIIYPYPDLVEDLKHILNDNSVNEPKILARFGANYLSSHGIGVYVIYSLRNLFVHGVIGFPEPNGENKPESAYPKIVNMSTRIVLLTLQMIWLAYYKGTGICSTLHWAPDVCEEKYYLEEILHKIHLKDYAVQRDIAKRQLNIQWENP